MSVSTGHVNMSGEWIEDPIDYKAVCEQLQSENEDLRDSLNSLNVFLGMLEDIRHVAMKVAQPFKKNPYLLIVACYIGFSFLDFMIRRRINNEG